MATPLMTTESGWSFLAVPAEGGGVVGGTAVVVEEGLAVEEEEEEETSKKATSSWCLDSPRPDPGKT